MDTRQNLRKVDGQLTAGLFEEFRELWMDYEDIAELVDKVESYREYSKGLEGGSQADYAAIHAIVGGILEDEEGTDTRTPLLKNTDRMGSELAFYLKQTQQVGVLFSDTQGYILPNTLPPADLLYVAYQSVEDMAGRGVLLTLEDNPVALINLDRIEYFLEHNRANVFDVITGINNRPPPPIVPSHLQSLLDGQRQDERGQEHDELHDAARKQLRELLIEKFGDVVGNCDLTELDATVEQIVNSRIVVAG